MATLTIRNLDDDVYRSLRDSAAANGRSMEAEARRLLDAGLRQSEQPRKLLRDMTEAERVEHWRMLQARAREALSEANGGVMPTGIVDEYLADKRREWIEEDRRHRAGAALDESAPS